jgi:hypothetical protein
MAQEKQPHLRAIESRFSELLVAEFETYCKNYEYDQRNIRSLLDYMLDRNLISTKAVRDFTIKLEFQQMDCKQGNKTNMVGLLSKKFAISERAIWMVLRELQEDKAD